MNKALMVMSVSFFIVSVFLYWIRPTMIEVALRWVKTESVARVLNGETNYNTEIDVLRLNLAKAMAWTTVFAVMALFGALSFLTFVVIMV